MQAIALRRQQLLDPYLSVMWEQMEREVQECQENRLQHKSQLAKVEAAIFKTLEALSQQGEPSNVAMPV